MGDFQISHASIEDEVDIVNVRKLIRDASKDIGFRMTDVTRIVTAASELARNVFLYAGSGMVHWCKCEKDTHVGIELIFEDHGPGILDVDKAMQMGYSSGKGLGMGLPGVKRLMSEMEITSEVDQGTRIRVIKWMNGFFDETMRYQ